MVQSKEDVRNRWERSTLEREERKWEGRGEREGEGRTEGGIDRERETHQMVSNESPWLHPPDPPPLGVC